MNEIRNNGVNFSTVSLGQVQQISHSSAPAQAAELETFFNRTLGSSSTASSQELSLDVIMSGSLGGYLGLGATAMDGLESPIASSQVLSAQNIASKSVFEPMSIVKDDKNAISIGMPEEMLTGKLPEETLANLAFSMEVNEVALGLVPGASFSPEQGAAVASVTNKTVHAPEFITMNNLQKEDFVLSSLPAETLSGWENNVASSGGTSLGLALEVPESLSALALERGANFNARPLASLPIVEGNKTSYDTAWTNISETLSAYESSSQTGVLALNDVWGKNSLGASNPVFSLGMEQNAPEIGFENVNKNDSLLGYRSFVSRELLGFIDLSPYSSTIAMNVNPTSIFSSLTPSRYLSNLLYGYTV